MGTGIGSSTGFHMGVEKELKEALKSKKVLLGSNSVIRAAKTGAVKTVIHASNLPETVTREMAYYGKMGNINVEKFEGNSKQLGELCGKPFNILLVGLKK